MTPMELDENAVAGIADSCDYTGDTITFDIVIYNAEIKLVEGTDYTITYKNNVNIGTATITITLLGNYSGTLIFTFEIVDTTGIEESQYTIHQSQFIYDLHGQRVSNPIKGIYIVKGKKVVIK